MKPDVSLSWETAPTTMGIGPSARGYHAATMAGDLLVVFGGFSKNNPSTDFGDLHALDTMSWNWITLTTLTSLSANSPGSRRESSITALGDLIIVYGGMRGSAVVSSIVYILDAVALRQESKISWKTPVPVKDGHPSATGRKGHGAVALSNTLMLVYGGDTQKPAPNRLSDDVLVYDTSSSTWLDLTVHGVTKPSGRSRYALASIDGGSSVVCLVG